jgi:succinate dehydrogenase flavin-adding protein (antitoxin of CptAB toxin-antitoxin module)
MLGLDGETNYNDMVKVHESLSYRFKSDINILSSMVNSFDEMLECKDNEYPVVINAFLQQEICLETVVILNKLTRFMEKADKQITETIMWPDLSRKVQKYDPFVSIDRDKMIKIVTKSFTS